MKSTEYKLSLRKTIFCGLCAVINIIGSFLALNFRLFVYIDTIGTILAGIALGPVYGLLTGLVGGLLASVLFDPTSFYYIPVQLIIGFLTGFFFYHKHLKLYQIIFVIFLITLIGSLTASLITTFVFSGITSSGSSYVVLVLKQLGLNLYSSVFSTQILTDLLDKYLSFGIAYLIYRALPKRLLN